MREAGEAGRPCRELAYRRLDRLIETTEGRLAGLKKLQKLAEVATDDPSFENLLYEMLERLS